MSYQHQPDVCAYGPPPYAVDSGYCPPPPPVIVCHPVGNCPVCHQGFLTSNITCLGVTCAILLFPIGLICLFLLQEQRCPVCGYTQ